MKRTKGFTLLEVLVATTIMAIAVGVLLSALTTSVRNASRLTDSDRAAILAKRLLDQMLLDPAFPSGQIVQGEFAIRTDGLRGGWRAKLEPLETLPNLPPEQATLGRLAVEVWWASGESRRTFQLEGYRRMRRL